MRPPPAAHSFAASAAVVVFGCTMATAARAQDPPATDIFLLHETTDGELEIRNITRRDGYDNQPYFSPDGSSIFYTSMRDGQTDAYRYDLRSTSTERITRTPESEYSPTVMPGARGLSVVRVEADSVQRLWAFDLDGSGPRLLFPEIRPVGYHAWVDEETVALFVLGDPPTLRLGDLPSGEAETVTDRIGRSLHRVPGRRALSFVHKTSEREWWIKELNLETGEIRPLVRTLEGSREARTTPGRPRERSSWVGTRASTGGVLRRAGIGNWRWTWRTGASPRSPASRCHRTGERSRSSRSRPPAEARGQDTGASPNTASLVV